MGTFTKAQLFKTVRIVEIEGKLDEIDSTERTQPILLNLIKAGVVIDLGFKIRFVPPECPNCHKHVQRSTISDEKDRTIEVRLFCPSCHWTEGMPK